MHAGLGNDLIRPALEGLGTAVCITGSLPLAAQRSVQRRQFGDAGTQVVFKTLELAGEVGKELRCVYHLGAP